MFSLFQKFAKVAAKPVEYKNARDMYSFAMHVVDANENALCGTVTALYGKYPMTVEKLMISAEHQHPNSYLCAACASVFTGESEEFFINAHKQANLDRAALAAARATIAARKK